MASQDDFYQPGEYFRKYQAHKKNAQSKENESVVDSEILSVDNAENRRDDVVSTTKVGKRSRTPMHHHRLQKKQKKWSWLPLLENCYPYWKTVTLHKRRRRNVSSKPIQSTSKPICGAFTQRQINHYFNFA